MANRIVMSENGFFANANGRLMCEYTNAHICENMRDVETMCGKFFACNPNAQKCIVVKNYGMENQQDVPVYRGRTTAFSVIAKA